MSWNVSEQTDIDWKRISLGRHQKTHYEEEEICIDEICLRVTTRLDVLNGRSDFTKYMATA